MLNFAESIIIEAQVTERESLEIWTIAENMIPMVLVDHIFAYFTSLF